MSVQRRVFVAVDISQEARAKVTEYILDLQRQFPAVKCRWVPPENLHITARFIGNVDDAGLERWKDIVSGAAHALSPFTIRLHGTGMFSQHRQRTDVLWIGVKADPPNRFIEIGSYLAEDKRVKPHLTIGRSKNSPMAADLLAAHSVAAFGPVSFQVDELVIYESTLAPQGSRYTPIHRARFEGNTP